MRRIVLALFVLIFLSSLQSTAQEIVEIKTPAFTVITDAGEARGRELAERFEHLRGAFGVFFNNKNVSLPVPLTIVAFKNSKDYRLFVPSWTEKTRMMWAGFARAGEDQNFIAIDLEPAGDRRKETPPLSAMDFAYLEMTKLLLAGNSPPLPAWYDKGFTEYCSSLKISSKQIEYGVPRPDVMNILKTQPWMRLVQFFGAPPSAPEDTESERKTIYYAQSWVTIHYLIANNLGSQLNLFVDLTQNQHMQIQEAIRRAFGVEPQSFENAVRNYFTVEMKNHKIALPADFGKSSTEVKPLRAADWTATWADLRAHTPNERDAGVELYRKVLLTDANNASANRGLGFSYLQNNEFDKAQAYLRKAVVADPGDARSHYFLALVANRKQRVLREEPVADLATVKEHLEKAIALKPNYADAYQLLSWAELEAKNTDGARAAIEKASDLNPRSDFVALSMAQLELQANQYEKARPMLERLQGSNQPEVARFAHDALQNIGTKKTPQSSIVTRQSITAPQWQTKEAPAENAENEKPPAPKQEKAAATESAGKIQFLKGELVEVDCSKSPMVTMTVSSKGKEWVMFSRDVHKLMLIGVENFSCNWMNKKASVNYRLTADGRGELISLEID